MNYAQAVAYIDEIPKFTKKNKPGNTLELLRRLGHPEETMQIVHVAGTNGKGSVCAFLSRILVESGAKTGLFTSPHLISINERFQVMEQPVDDETFTRAFGQVMEQVRAMTAEGWYHPTYFELLFAIGMVIFSEAKVDWLVMETGLGGRLDATNTVARPKACVITSISLDHTEYLGNTIPAIAGEKAGIIKPGVPVIYDASNREAAAVIEAAAQKAGSRTWPWYPRMSRIVSRSMDGITYVLNNRLFDYVQVDVPFPADYQAANSSLAMMTARILDPDKLITDRAMAGAVSRTKWSGRMEMILPGVMIDGAHNADGIAQFLKTVRMAAKERRVSLLFAAVTEKDYEEMIRELAEGVPFESVTVTCVGGSRRVDAGKLASIFRKYTKAPVCSADDPRDAFRKALAARPQNGILFCTGSLYLVSEIKEAVSTQQVRS